LLATVFRDLTLVTLLPGLHWIGPGLSTRSLSVNPKLNSQPYGSPASLQSSRVFVFPFFASPVSFVSSEPVESAVSTVPKESFTSSLLTSASVNAGRFVCSFIDTSPWNRYDTELALARWSKQTTASFPEKLGWRFSSPPRGEKLLDLSAFPFQPFEALLSSLGRDRASSASVESAGRTAVRGSRCQAAWLHSIGCPFQLAIPSTAIPGPAAD